MTTDGTPPKKRRGKVTLRHSSTVLMATVSINYNFAHFRAKVAPNTVLNDVLVDSLRHYKLLDDEAPNNCQDWVLLHNKKPVTLDLPWRFLNLSTGVNLELKKSEAGSKADEVNSVKIKWQVTGHKTIVETIRSSADLKDVLDVLASKHGWSLESSNTKLQVFSKVVPYAELRGLTLDDLGVKSSALVRLTNSETIQQDSSGVDPNKEEQVAAKPEDLKGTETLAKKHVLHEVSAYIPTDTSIAKQIQKDENADDYEMTVDQARRYQHMLLKQTGGLGGPLMTKRLRQEKEESAKTVVKECVVRIRFPDLTHIEVAFEPAESMKTIYKVVSESLIDDSMNFTLNQPHPFEVYQPDDRKLVDELGFGTKTLLMFDCKDKGPYLRNEILGSAKGLTDADDVRRDRGEHSSDEKISDDVVKPKISTSDPKIKKIPKWLKLSKK